MHLYIRLSKKPIRDCGVPKSTISADVGRLSVGVGEISSNAGFTGGGTRGAAMWSALLRRNSN